LKDIDIVFHQAGYSTSKKFEEDLVNGISTNVLGFINVLEAAKKNGVKKIIFASSSSVYGDAPIPHREATPPSPVNLYGETKLTNERFAKFYAENFDISVVGLRYFSVYGFHEEVKEKFANLITQVFWAAINNVESLVILGDPHYTRDYVFVSDVVQANILAMNAKLKSNFSIYNVGYGKNYSLEEAVKLINNILGTNVRPKYLLDKKNRMKHTLADIYKLKKELNYHPRFDLERGIKAMWEAQKK
jgi:nucleoside-diphosphate-sugar epimerase